MILFVRLRHCLLCLALFLGVSSPVLSQVPAAQSSAPAQVEQRKTSTPYTGDLTIFDSAGRDQKLHINRVMDILAVSPGKGVADIGAGSGWFTMLAAQRVTGSGTVYAVDINREAIDYIKARAAKEHRDNVRTILSQPDDPELPVKSVDSVLLLKTYHEVSHPVVLLRNLQPALRPGARVGVIDRTGDGADHGVQKDVVLREMKQAGYRLLEEHDDLVKGDKMDYFLVFVAE